MITDKMFVIAEDCTSPRWGVWVMLTTYAQSFAHGIETVAFTVTTSTGYRAELPACLMEHVPGFVNCVRPLTERHQHSGMSVNKWLDHCKTHCHSFHLARAEWFRDRVMETYA